MMFLVELKKEREKEKKKREKTIFGKENWNKKLEDDMYHTYSQRPKMAPLRLKMIILFLNAQVF